MQNNFTPVKSFQHENIYFLAMLVSCQIKIRNLHWKRGVNKIFLPLNHCEWKPQCPKVRYHSKQRSILEETQSILVEASRCSSCSHSCVCNLAACLCCVYVCGEKKICAGNLRPLCYCCCSHVSTVGLFWATSARDVGVWCVGSQIQIQQTKHLLTAA